MEKSIFIPDDVIEEILLRLPVEDLLLWKCVSKRWYILIWDNDFVKKHYRFHYAMRLASHGDAPLLINFPNGQFHLLSKQGERDVVMTSFPDYGTASRVPEPRVHCIGVVNGIVGLQWNRGCLALWSLWNPATTEFKDVPRLLVDDKDAQVGSPTIIGLGFDLQSKDFKILGGLYAGYKDIVIKYYLYSLRADSWKRVKDTPRTYTKLNILSTPDGYLSYGVWYWIAYVLDHSRPAGIVAFNFSSEVFKEVELPSSITQFHGILRIGKYKEELAMFQYPKLDSEDKCIKIWAATRFCDDDYEVPSSWELVVKIPPINLVNDFFIQAIFDCGDLLLDLEIPETNDGEGGDSYVPGTYVYHPSTRTFKYLAPMFRSSYKYMESLFPLSRRLNYINSTS